MPDNHGRKCRVQVLLEPHRARVLERLCAAEGVRLSELLRELAYGYAKAGDEEGYAEALVRDRAIKAEIGAIRSRIAREAAAARKAATVLQ